jgi:hypothetical protein
MCPFPPKGKALMQDLQAVFRRGEELRQRLDDVADEGASVLMAEVERLDVFDVRAVAFSAVADGVLTGRESVGAKAWWAS